MSDLERFRDHAREMANRTSHDLLDQPSGNCRRRQHEWCLTGPDSCPCACHEAHRAPIPTPAERELWARLADEVDAHLAPDDDQLELA